MTGTWVVFRENEHRQAVGVVTRVWQNGNYVTIVSDGRTFVRDRRNVQPSAADGEWLTLDCGCAWTLGIDLPTRECAMHAADQTLPHNPRAAIAIEKCPTCGSADISSLRQGWDICASCKAKFACAGGSR